MDVFLAVCFLNLDTRGVMRKKRRPPPGQGGGNSRFPFRIGVDFVRFMVIGLLRPVIVRDFVETGVGNAEELLDSSASRIEMSRLGEIPPAVTDEIRCGDSALRCGEGIVRLGGDGGRGGGAVRARNCMGKGEDRDREGGHLVLGDDGIAGAVGGTGLMINVLARSGDPLAASSTSRGGCVPLGRGFLLIIGDVCPDSTTVQCSFSDKTFS